MADLADAGMTTLPLDVTDETSMASAVASAESQAGPLDVLVNNAGYGLYGPVEQVPMEAIRQQFETNVFGLVRMIQLALPGMRRAGSGRIINVSSMGGRVTLPGGAFYHATKHAVEALSDALRVELHPFGISVVLVEPGPVKTPWNDTAAGSLAGSQPSDPAQDDDPYAAFKLAVAGGFGSVAEGPTSRLSSTADDVAKVIARAAKARRPRTRYLVNPVARGLVTADALLPDRAWDALVRRQFNLP
jgi:NAD(P)-dependent dehydrogenase (short-subunit alcohol dehydrogenase family)